MVLVVQIEKTCTATVGCYIGKDIVNLFVYDEGRGCFLLEVEHDGLMFAVSLPCPRECHARGEFPVEGAGCERDVVCTLPFFSVEFLGFLGRGDSVDDKPVHVPCLACEYFFHVVFIFAGSDGKQCEGQIEDELDSFHVCMCMISLNTVPSEQGVDGGCLSSETLVKCHGVFCAAA